MNYSSSPSPEDIPRLEDRMMKWTLSTYTATIFLSAVLLFSIQPYFSKVVLPKLGGTPGVWSVAMVFFQGVLLLGYAYAHALTRYATVQVANLTHLTVLGAAATFLPLGIAQGWDTPPTAGQEFWLIGLFSASIGLPFFAISANAPLLQAWFSRTNHAQANDPYFLYGASNIGSFASLFGYVILIEPNLTLAKQSLTWSLGYGLLVAGIALCAWCAARARFHGNRQTSSGIGETKPALRTISPVRRLKFIGLAALPSALTIAVTAHVSVDVASAPFLWILPLSLFLLTFVLAFRTNPVISYPILSIITSWAVIPVILSVFIGPFLPITLVLFSNLLAFFLAAFLCHSALYRIRPPANQLTEFYLLMSLGGVTGGIFSGLLAPNIFEWVAEYPLLLLCTLLITPATAVPKTRTLLLSLVAAIFISASIYHLSRNGWLPVFNSLLGPLVGLFVCLVMAVLVQNKSRALGLALLVLSIPFGLLLYEAQTDMHSERSFFGVVSVDLDREKTHHIMRHGTTVHGAMATSDLSRASDSGKPEPLTYYHRSGEMAATLRSVQNRVDSPQFHGGIVGLGTGSFLCHSRPDERWTVFEIDQTVIDVAEDKNLFRFVSDCAPDTNMVVGDARLTLESQPDKSFDYLLIDAFSSDAIPVHLMTREAIDLYFRKLSPKGLLAIHISNRHLELGAVLAAIAEKDNYHIRVAKFNRTEKLPPYVFKAQVAVLAVDLDALGELQESVDWKQIEPGDITPWTDDYSNIIDAMRRKMGQKETR